MAKGELSKKFFFFFSFLSTLSSLTNRTRFVSLWASSFKNQPKCHFTTRNSNELCNYLLIWYWNWKIANCKRDEARNEVKAIFLFFWILFFHFFYCCDAISRLFFFIPRERLRMQIRNSQRLFLGSDGNSISWHCLIASSDMSTDNRSDELAM